MLAKLEAWTWQSMSVMYGSIIAYLQHIQAISRSTIANHFSELGSWKCSTRVKYDLQFNSLVMELTDNKFLEKFGTWRTKDDFNRGAANCTFFPKSRITNHLLLGFYLGLSLENKLRIQWTNMSYELMLWVYDPRREMQISSWSLSSVLHVPDFTHNFIR